MFAAVLSGVFSWAVSKPVDETAGWRIERVAISKGGRWIAVGSASGWIGIIDQTQPDSPQRFRGGTGDLRDLRFSHDDQWLIVANDKPSRHPVQSLGSLELLAPGEDPGEPQVEVPWTEEHSSNVVAGPGGIAVFGNPEGSIEVHDTGTGKMLRRVTFR